MIIRIGTNGLVTNTLFGTLCDFQLVFAVATHIHNRKLGCAITGNPGNFPPVNTFPQFDISYDAAKCLYFSSIRRTAVSPFMAISRLQTHNQ